MRHQTLQTVVSCNTAATNTHDDPWCGRHTRPPGAGSAPRRVPASEASNSAFRGSTWSAVNRSSNRHLLTVAILAHCVSLGLLARLAIRFFVGCALIIPMIIQTIGLYPSGAVWTDEASNVSRPDPSGALQTDAEHPTRNRKVEGSNPSSGSKTAGQRVFLAMLTGQRQLAVIPLVGHRAVSASAPLRYEESVWPIEGPSMGLLRRPTTSELWKTDDWAGPCGPGALRARSEKTSLRLCRLPHFYTQSGQVAWRCRSGTCSLLCAVSGCGTRRR
jgi:hypothetical protein